MEILNAAFNIAAVGISCGVVTSVAVLLVKQVLHIFEISSR